MAYIGKSPTGTGVRQRYHFTATGGETSLSGADDNNKTLKFTDGEFVDVYLNGVLLVQGSDYGVGTANTISSLSALTAGQIVEIVVYDIFTVAKINSEAVRSRHYFTASGGETSIGTSQIAGLSFAANAEIDVSLNGVTLVAGTDYNTTSANTVGGLVALSASDVVEIVIYEKFQLADMLSKSAGGTIGGNVTVNGTLTATSFSGSGSGLTGTGMSVAIIADEKTQGTASGSATAGSWYDRDLNTELADPDGIVSVASNQFTLGAGKYFIEFSVPAYDCAKHRSRLYNVTTSSVVANSNTGQLDASDNIGSTTSGKGYVDISSNTVFKIQQRVTTTRATNGQGLAFNQSGETELYTIVTIFKIG